LNATPPAFVSQIGRVDMVVPVGNEQRQRREPVENLSAVPRSGKALEKLLQYEPGRHELLARFDGTDQFEPLVRRGRRVAPKG
jgi:hypothetical protein